MSHNLKVVRIEDFLVNSRQLAFEMIDFAHFGPSGHLNDWLNTHLNEETEKTFLSWRTSLSYNQVAAIEHTCKDVLKEIGYSLANNIHVFEDAKIRLVFYLSFNWKAFVFRLWTSEYELLKFRLVWDFGFMPLWWRSRDLWHSNRIQRVFANQSMSLNHHFSLDITSMQLIRHWKNLKTRKSLRGVNELEETLINLHSFNQIK